MDTLTGSEYTLETTYLNTASHGLLPARTTAVLHRAVVDMAAGRIDQLHYYQAADTARASLARILGVPPERVALGGTVAVHVAVVAASLPAGAQVLVVDGDFTSLVNPFTMRGDLQVRSVPLEELVEAVRPRTALVAVSAVQSADGRIADLAAVRRAARAHGARVLVDTTQATGWFAVDPRHYDYLVCAAYKWLLCPRGTSFLVTPEDGGELLPLHAGWRAAEEPWANCYGPVERLATGARRFDEGPAFLPYLGAERSLTLVEELGVQAIAAHDRALAERFRQGVRALGHQPVEADSAIVAVPGLGHAADRLRRAGVDVSVRAGNLRASFHVFNRAADVDRLLEVLAEA